MECDEIRGHLGAYVDNELGEAEEADLRRHIAGCPECGPDTRQWCQTWHP